MLLQKKAFFSQLVANRREPALVPGPNTIVVESGDTLPTTLVAGKTYWIKASTRTGNWRVDNGVRLVSIDGPGQARLQPSDNNTATITGRGETDVIIDGLSLRAATNRAAIEFTEAGTGGSNFCHDIQIINCSIDTAAGGCNDGIKIAQTSGLVITNCKLDGRFNEEAIDCVTIEDFLIAFNTIDGNSLEHLSGITIKGGSRFGTVRRNHVHHIGQDGILIGGLTDNNLLYFGTNPPFEARNITVEENLSENITNKRPLNMIAAGNILVQNNRFDRDGNGNNGAVRLEAHPTRGWVTANVTLLNNSVDAADWLSVQAGSGGGLINSGNVINGFWNFQVGSNL